MKKLILGLIIIFTVMTSCNNIAETPESPSGSKYRYTVNPHGLTTLYYTNNVTVRDNGCVEFTGISATDDKEKPYVVCGSYTIE